MLDENISPALCPEIILLGHHARHIRDVGLLSFSDDKIFDFALQSGDVIITHDLDYSRIHALSGQAKPSVILLRLEPVSNDMILSFLKGNLLQIIDSLEKGAFIVVEKDQMRIRDLPIRK